MLPNAPSTPSATAFRPTGLVIRRAELRDFPALADLYLDVRQKSFSWLPPSLFQREDFFRDTHGEVIWLAAEDGTILGFASVYLDSAFLHSLYIRADAQRRGVGSRLLAQVIRTTQGRVTLKCLTFNRAAQAFYQAHGWSIIGSGESAHGPYVTFAAPLPPTPNAPQ